MDQGFVNIKAKSRLPCSLPLPSFIVSQEQIQLSSSTVISRTKKINIQLVKYDINHYSDSLYAASDIDFPANFEHMAVKRRARFLAGRLAARIALESLNTPSTQVPVGIDRQPAWPINISGSISHTDNFSIATAESFEHSPMKHIGLDVQAELSDNEVELLLQTVLTENDLKILQPGVTGLNRNQLFTLIFSAKESFFKASYPQVKRYFDFNVVSVESVNMQNHQLTLKCETTLTIDIIAGTKYPVLFEFAEIGKPLVITYVRM